MTDLSVILSTRNRVELLEQTLRGIAEQSLEGLTLQVIVVDNGSTDETPTVLANWAGRLPLVALSQPVPGKNRALNLALEKSQGELLVFTDDDIVPSNRWLHEMHSGACRWPHDAIFGGKIVPRFPAGTPPFVASRTFAFAPTAFAWYEPTAAEGPVSLSPFGPNLALRRSVFETFRYNESIGPAGHDYAMGSEFELLLRLQAAGHRFVYLPGAAVEHVVRPEQVTMKWLKARARRAGRGDARLSEPISNAPVAFGVPRYIWRRYFESMLQYAGSWLGGREKRCLAMIQLTRLGSQIAEMRRISTETRNPRSDDSTNHAAQVQS